MNPSRSDVAFAFATTLNNPYSDIKTRIYSLRSSPRLELDPGHTITVETSADRMP